MNMTAMSDPVEFLRARHVALVEFWKRLIMAVWRMPRRALGAIDPYSYALTLHDELERIRR